MKMAHFVKIVEQFVLQENVGAAWDKFMQQMCEVQSLKQLFGVSATKSSFTTNISEEWHAIVSLRARQLAFKK